MTDSTEQIRQQAVAEWMQRHPHDDEETARFAVTQTASGARLQLRLAFRRLVLGVARLVWDTVRGKLRLR